MNPIRSVAPRHLLILAVILLSVPLHMAVKGMAWYQPVRPVAPGEPAPSFRLADATGRIFTLSGFDAAAVLVTFCNLDEPACHAQGRDLNRFVQAYAHRGLEVLLLADSASVDSINRFDAMIDAEYHILQDRGGKVRDKYRATVLPTHFLIDRQGTVYWVQAGRIRQSSGRTRRIVEFILNKEAP